MPPSLSVGQNNPSWLSNSLTSFWQAVNWENLQIPVPTNSSSLDRYLSVKDYFQSIPWVITTTAAPQLVNDPSAMNGQSPQDTLNDFLQDISEFF
jgi:hypothetical protein